LSGELRGDIVLHMDNPTDMRAACARCGRRNDKDANFCQNCGTPIVRKPESTKIRLVITERAVRELRAVGAANIKDECEVLRIDNEPDGLSLSVGPRQGGDSLVGSEDTILLHASAEAVRLLDERSMVIHCIDGRLIIYAEDDSPGAEAS
jgi:DNA-directed RNA polymerase subunit RPC12/RpoP